MQKIRSLIVDDEEMLRNGIARLLTGCGEEWEVVATLSDGKEALDYLSGSEEGIDLLITDVKMPEMDGLTLITEGKKLHSFRALVISGYDEFRYVQTALREGAIDYLLKPIDREEFRKRLAEIRTSIMAERLKDKRWSEMEHTSEKLKATRQIQLLSYVTSAGLDISRLGYWVEEFPKGLYIMLHVSLDTPSAAAGSYTSKDWAAYGYVLENMISEVADTYSGQLNGCSWCWRGGDSNYWVLLYLGKPNTEENEPPNTVIKELSRRIRSSVSAYTPFTVSVACGSPIEDLYLLPDAKEQAEILLHYRLLHGGDRLYGAEELHMGVWPAADMLEESFVQLSVRLRQAVEQVNDAEAAELSSAFFELLGKESSPQTIRQIVKNVYILIHSAGIEREGIPVTAALEKGLQRLNQASRLPELKEEIDVRVKELIHLLREARKSGSMEVIELAKAWISAHLHDELTIKAIADYVHMNPSYFCRHFKAQTGQTLLDFITGLRMTKAKELLSNPNLKLYDISTQIGYQDVKYFSRLFKQTVGETPSKYREQLL